VVTGESGAARGIVSEARSAPVRWAMSARGRKTYGGYYRFLIYDILRRCPASYIRGPLGIGPG